MYTERVVISKLLACFIEKFYDGTRADGDKIARRERRDFNYFAEISILSQREYLM
jgi:hypothetical protein